VSEDWTECTVTSHILQTCQSKHTTLSRVPIHNTDFDSAVIPFIVHPIDNGIHAIMNASLRPAMRKYICGPGQGDLAQLDTCAEEECIPGGATSGPPPTPPQNALTSHASQYLSRKGRCRLCGFWQG